MIDKAAVAAAPGGGAKEWGSTTAMPIASFPLGGLRPNGVDVVACFRTAMEKKKKGSARRFRQRG